MYRNTEKTHRNITATHKRVMALHQNPKRRDDRRETEL